jgi:hypothetical protein
MSASSESFAHGEHNEKACDLLALNQGFPDWVITTAFYASLHFVTSKIFPFDYTVKTGTTLKFEISLHGKNSKATHQIKDMSL